MGSQDARSPGDLLFQSIFDHLSDPTVLLSGDQHVLLLNRAARELRGVDVEALFAPGSQDLDFFYGQVRLWGHASAELSVKRADGGIRQLELEGRMEGDFRVVVVRDVTERRQFEEELQHLRRVESFGYFIASASHDLNNLLTVIACSTVALSNEARANGQAAGEQMVALADEIRLASERAVSMVRQLLSRLHRKQSRPEALNVGEVVEEMRPLLARLVGGGVEVSLVADPDLGLTVVDRGSLEHALLNLAANARDAMPDGGRFTIAVRDVNLGEDTASEDLPPSGRYVSLSASDSGVGMSREVRERIFEKFFTTKGNANGTGLGLAMVRRFALQSGGCVAAHSEPGHGTTIVLYLPRMARALGSAAVMSCGLP